MVARMVESPSPPGKKKLPALDMSALGAKKKAWHVL
jgi:hypothetical protein